MSSKTKLYNSSKKIGADDDEDAFANIENLEITSLIVYGDAEIQGNIAFSTLDINTLGSYQQTGAVDYNNQELTSLNIKSGEINNSNIGVLTPANGYFNNISSGLSGSGYNVTFYGNDTGTKFEFDGANNILNMDVNTGLKITNPDGIFHVSDIYYNTGQVKIDNNQTIPSSGKIVSGTGISFPEDIVGYYLVLADKTKTKIVERVSSSLLTVDGPDSNGQDMLKSLQNYAIYYPGTYFDAFGNLNSNNSGFMKIPVGTTAQRPTSSSQGYIRFNTSLGKYEGYSGTAWGKLGGSDSVSGTTKMVFDTFIGDDKIRFKSSNIERVVMYKNNSVSIGYINTYGNMTGALDNNLLNEISDNTNLIEDLNITVDSELIDQQTNLNLLVTTVTDSQLTIIKTSDFSLTDSSSKILQSGGDNLRLYPDPRSSLDIYGSQSVPLGATSVIASSLTFSGGFIDDLTISPSSYVSMISKDFLVKITSISALNDLISSISDMSGSATVRVVIDGVGNEANTISDTFKISYDNGSSYPSTGISIGTSNIMNIPDNTGSLSLYFQGKYDHLLGSYWNISLNNTTISSIFVNSGIDGFSWKLSTDESYGSNTNITGSAQSLGSTGVNISFANTEGHTLDSIWNFNVANKTFFQVTNDSDIIYSNHDLTNLVSVNDVITIKDENAQKRSFQILELQPYTGSVTSYPVKINRPYPFTSIGTLSCFIDNKLIGLYNGFGTEKFSVDRSGNVGIGVGIDKQNEYPLNINSSNAIRLPSGTTAQRPTSLTSGLLRYNTTESNLEYYKSGGWTLIGSSGILSTSDNANIIDLNSDSLNIVIDSSTLTTGNTASFTVISSVIDMYDGSISLLHLNSGSITMLSDVYNINNSTGSNILTLTTSSITATSNIITLNSSLTTFQSSITNINVSDSFSLTSGDIVSINGSVTNIQGSITNIIGDSVNISGITSVTGDTIINSSLTTFQSSITNINVSDSFSLTSGDIVSVNGSVTNIQGSITNIIGDTVNISGITSITGDTIINSSLTTFQSSITNINVSDSFSLTSGDIVSINGSVTNIQGSITNIIGDTVNISGITSITGDTIINSSLTTFQSSITNINVSDSFSLTSDNIIDISGSVTTLQSSITNIIGDSVNISGITSVTGDTIINSSLTTFQSSITNINVSDSFSLTSGDIVSINGSVTNIQGSITNIIGDSVNINGITSITGNLNVEGNISGNISSTIGDPTSGTYTDNPLLTNNDLMSDAFQTLDIWINKHLVDTPPVPTLIGSIVDSSKILINWSNPTQFQIGFSDISVPKINSMNIDYKKSSDPTYTTINTGNSTITNAVFFVEGSGSGVSGNAYNFYTIDKETDYDFRVYGINDNSERDLHYLSLSALATLGIGFPGMVLNLGNSAIDHDSFSLSYQKPTYNDVFNETTTTPNISNYEINYDAQSSTRYGGLISHTGSVTTSNLTYNLNNLNPKTSYNIKVAALNTQNASYGSYSDILSLTTDYPTAPSYLSSNQFQTISNLSSIDSTYQSTGYSLDGATAISDPILNQSEVSTNKISVSSSTLYRSNYTESTTLTNIGSITARMGLVSDLSNSVNNETVVIDGFGISDVEGTYTNTYVNLIISKDRDYYDTGAVNYQGFYKSLQMSFESPASQSAYYKGRTDTYGFNLSLNVTGYQLLNTDTYNFYIDNLSSTPAIDNLLIRGINTSGATNVDYISGVMVYKSGTYFEFQYNQSELGNYFLRNDRKHTEVKVQTSEGIGMGSLVIDRTDFSSGGSKYYTVNANRYETSTTLYETNGYTLNGSDSRSDMQINDFTVTLNSNANSLYDENLKLVATPYNLKGVGSSVNGYATNVTNNADLGDIRIDGMSLITMSSLTNASGSYGVRVRSGSLTIYPNLGTGDNDCGGTYDHTISIAQDVGVFYASELQMINGYHDSDNTYGYKDYSSYYSGDVSYTYPNCSSIYVVDDFKYITFKYTNRISNANGLTLDLIDSSGLVGAVDSNVSIHIKINNDSDSSNNTGWLVCEAVSGIGVTSVNKGDGVTCLSLSNPTSTNIKKHCYLPVSTTAEDCYVRIGVKLGSEIKFRYIKVTSGFV